MRSQQEFARVSHKPEWFTIKPKPHAFEGIKKILARHGLHSVCEEAHCPNLPECWGEAKTATFLLMGDVCTRACRFCYVKSGKPAALDASEPKKVADAIVESGFEYVVLTSVNRDDLRDGGASHFAACISEIKQKNKKLVVEVLIPDFQGKMADVQKIIDAGADVIAHNIETVERLQSKVRDRRASYQQSVAVLKYVKSSSPATYTKSSIMLGMGETEKEIAQSFDDLRAAGVDILTLGQYLQPSSIHYPVVEYVKPEKFENLKALALSKGFKFVAAGPFVRSSYRAGEHMNI